MGLQFVTTTDDQSPSIFNFSKTIRIEEIKQ